MQRRKTQPESYPRSLATSWSMARVITRSWMWSIGAITTVLGIGVAIVNTAQGVSAGMTGASVLSVAGFGTLIGVVGSVTVTLRALDVVSAGATRSQIARVLPLSYLILALSTLPACLLGWVFTLLAIPGSVFVKTTSISQPPLIVLPLCWCVSILALFLVMGVGTLMFKRAPIPLIVGMLLLMVFISPIVEAIFKLGKAGETLMFFLPDPSILNDFTWSTGSFDHAGWLLVGSGLLWLLLRRWEPSR